MRAQVYVRDKDYLVRDGRVVILSQSTGRAMDRTRYQDGLHQAYPSALHLLQCPFRSAPFGFVRGQEQWVACFTRETVTEVHGQWLIETAAGCTTWDTAWHRGLQLYEGI